jgi:hypothetical protein
LGGFFLGECFGAGVLGFLGELLGKFLKMRADFFFANFAQRGVGAFVSRWDLRSYDFWIFAKEVHFRGGFWLGRACGGGSWEVGSVTLMGAGLGLERLENTL